MHLSLIHIYTVPDYVPVLILMAGLLEVEFAPALLGLVLVPLPFVVAALMKEGSIGGGDIKLMGACGFVLGVKRGYIALMLGLFLAVLFQTAYAKKEDKGFAMAPYLDVYKRQPPYCPAAASHSCPVLKFPMALIYFPLSARPSSIPAWDLQ